MKKTLLTSFEPTETVTLLSQDGAIFKDDTIFYHGSRSIRFTAPSSSENLIGPLARTDFTVYFDLSTIDGVLFYLRAADPATADAMTQGSPPEHGQPLTVRLTDFNGISTIYSGKALLNVRVGLWEPIFIPASLFTPQVSTVQLQSIASVTIGIQPSAVQTGPFVNLACNIDALYAIYFHSAQID